MPQNPIHSVSPMNPEQDASAATTVADIIPYTQEPVQHDIDIRLGRPGRAWAYAYKRPCDFITALVALICISPLLLVIMLLLFIFQGGNPFFCQTRIGRNLKPFGVIKFRTMTNERDAAGKLLPDEERTTLIGKILRSTSLDELPELINVLVGHMSFIGPRPWVPEQMETFPIGVRRHRMRIRPGISGLAQIQGRNNLTFRQRVSYDLRYQKRLSFTLDIKILFYTIYKVLCRDGIEQRPDALAHVHVAHPKDPETKGLRGNKPREYKTPEKN